MAEPAEEWADYPVDEPAVEPSWSPPAPSAPQAGSVRAALRRVRSAMPPTVLGARVDPGRAGAAALLAVAVTAAAVVGVLVLRDRPREVPPPSAVVRPGGPLPGTSATPSAASEVVVSVGGRVVRPGLYRLPVGSRVDDAVRAAGGPAAGVPVGDLNLARKLVDGEQVLVGVAAPAAAAGGAASTSGPVDLNAATAEQLDALPGVGPVLAERIVQWRTENGRFASVDQLREVPGIGESKYSALKSKVRV